MLQRRQRTPAAARPYIQRAAQGSRARQSAFVSRRAQAPRPYRGLPAGVEYKAIDVSNPNAQVTNAGGVVLLNGCARGDDIGERDGRQITLRSVDIRMELQPIGTATSPHAIRIIVFVDKQANGTAPTPANVLTLTGSAEATVSAQNLEYRNRFWILSDKVYTFGCEYGGAAVGVEKLVATRFWRSLNIKTTFNSGTAGTVADIATNSLYLLAISDTATAAQEPFLQFYSRVRFTDD